MMRLARSLVWLTSCGVVLTLTGCLMLDFRDQYISRQGDSLEQGEIAPSFHLKHQSHSIPLLPLVITSESPPHDLVMSTFDKSYAGFREFVIESLEIQFEDQAPVLLMTQETSLHKRTIAIPAKPVGDDSRRIFRGAITQRKSFVVTLRGVAVRENGERVPFTRRAAWKYDGRERMFYTLFDAIASV